MPESLPEYLTVAEAATRLGVSPRAVQKRCANGKLAARRTGGQWEVLASELAQAGEPQNEPVREPNEPKFANRTGGERTDSLSKRTGVREQTNQSGELVRDSVREPANQNEPANADYLAHLKAENTFLRGLVEQRDRDAAELRAALRKALDAMPKAITSGDQLEQVGTGNQSRENALQAPQSATGDQRGATGKASAQRGKKPRELTAWQRIAARVLGIR